jgi:hypothetical protein
MSQVDLKTALEFALRERLAVLSTVSPSYEPEAALMGIAVTPAFEIIFDCVKTARKYPNLCANPKAAFVIGCTSEISIQYEGIAEELSGEELQKYLQIYFAALPDAMGRRDRPGGVTYFVVRPKWLRYCDHSQRPPSRTEFTF